MKGDRLVKWFMPKEERFRELLDRDTQHLLTAARLFAELAKSTSLDERREQLLRLTTAEKQGDKITAEIFSALNMTFITPLDREDIRAIASDLDDILDYLEGVAQYIILFELSASPDPLRRFADILVSMVEAIHEVTSLIWDLANEKKIGESIVRISQLENEADALYFKVIAELFRGGDGRDPIEILKWKEVYDGLENACDECKEYTHVVSNVVIKNA
jgi:predicted phosphate transport protein (TIGR00153 family)